MDFETPSVLVVGATIAVVSAAMVTDVRTRRIPNVLTFPAMGLGVAQAAFSDGLSGGLASLLGLVLAPVTLLVVRAFRPLGMGDIKLAAAVGALLGPVLGAIAMVVSAFVGGFVAIAWALRPGGVAGATVAPFLIGVPVLGRLWAKPGTDNFPVGQVRIPYGVAIGLGSLLSLGVVRWT
jgi:prepilin peptidase CpaA